MAVVRYRRLWSAALLLSVSGCALRGFPPRRPAFAQRDRARAERLNEQGLALVESGEFAEAEATLREALQADPYHGPAHCNLGLILLQQGKFYEAGWELRYACQLMPRAGQPRANLGILYETVGRYGPAEEHLRAALRLCPDDIEVIGHLARVHVRQDKRTPETLAWLQAVASQDDDPAWRRWAGELLVTTNSSESQIEGTP
jgi:Flp pilus assembly protein TadD